MASLSQCPEWYVPDHTAEYCFPSLQQGPIRRGLHSSNSRLALELTGVLLKLVHVSVPIRSQQAILRQEVASHAVYRTARIGFGQQGATSTVLYRVESMRSGRSVLYGLPILTLIFSCGNAMYYCNYCISFTLTSCDCRSERCFQVRARTTRLTMNLVARA